MDTPDHIRIPLRKRDGEIIAYTLIDAADAELAKHTWSLSRGYAVRAVPRSSGHRHQIRLHREVVGLKFGDPLQVDHINRDRLDNRRENLRVVTAAQQGQNVPSHGRTSQYRGVCWVERLGKWKAAVTINRQTFNLGHYASEEKAARVASDFRRTHMPFAVEDDEPRGLAA